jgi:hypothetical protein
MAAVARDSLGKHGLISEASTLPRYEAGSVTLQISGGNKRDKRIGHMLLEHP